jgi:hypothetical protein
MVGGLYNPTSRRDEFVFVLPTYGLYTDDRNILDNVEQLPGDR